MNPNLVPVFPSRPFVRTPFTWLTYLMLGYFAYLQVALGPLLPFLRAELDLSYTVASLHFSAFALGMILTGIFSERVIHRWGRQMTFWASGIGMALGALCVAVGSHVVVTLPGAFGMGLLGSGLVVLIPASLSDHYGEQRATALTESNAMASLCVMLVPLFVGVFERVGLGWRSVLLLPIVMLALIGARYRRVAIPEPRDSPGEPDPRPGTKLSAAFWVFCIVMFLIVSTEWSLVVWGAAYLEDAVGLRKADAATLMSLFFLAMLLGRLTASRLSHLAPSTALLFIALGITAIGFPLFWLAPFAPINVAGLFVAGVGVANLYPFTIASAIGVVPGRSDTAAARLSLTVGAAILLVPLALGGIADHLGLRQAYGLVAVLLLAAVGMTALANHLSARSTSVSSK